MNTIMHKEKQTQWILQVLHVVAWIIFIGLCIKAGAILYSCAVTFFNPPAAKNLYEGLDLSELYYQGVVYYALVVSLIIFISVLKAFVFYLVIRIFPKMNLVHPFSKEVGSLIKRMSQVALWIGILTLIAENFYSSLAKKNAELPALGEYLGGGEEFLLFVGVLFVISLVFKRGIELQAENDLTV